MTWNAEALAKLGRNAKAFGEAYVAIKESLIRHGVPLEEAREEARSAAAMAAIFDQMEEGGDCPLCGGTGEL